MVSIKKETKEEEDTDNEEEAKISPPPEFGSSSLVLLSTEQSLATKFPVGCPVWTACEIDATHLSWTEGVVVSVFMDLVKRDYVYRVELLRVEDEVICIDSDSDADNDGTKDLTMLQNLWENQLSYAIGCPVKIQSQAGANQWSDGTIFHNCISSQSGRAYAVRLGLSSRVELEVAESRIKFRKVVTAHVSLGESGVQSENQKPVAKEGTPSEADSKIPLTGEQAHEPLEHVHAKQDARITHNVSTVQEDEDSSKPMNSVDCMMRTSSGSDLIAARWVPPGAKRKIDPVEESSISSISNEIKVSKSVVVNEGCILAINSWVAKCRSPSGYTLFEHLNGEDGCKIRQFSSLSQCTIHLMPTNWKVGDPLRICIKAAPCQGDLLRAARRVFLRMLMEFFAEPNAKARLEHELLCFEEGPLSCKRSHGCILVPKSGTHHWSRLIELPQHGLDASRLVGSADGCHIEVHRNEANDKHAVCDPFLVVYGPEPAKVKQAAGKVAKALSSSVDPLVATKRPTCMGGNSPSERPMKNARTSCDNIATVVRSHKPFVLEIIIPGWMFKARTRIYEHIFGTQPDTLDNMLNKIGCALERKVDTRDTVVIRSNGTASEGKVIKLFEDSLLQILSKEGDERANDKLLYELSALYRHNKGHGDMKRIRDLNADRTVHNRPALWACVMELPVLNSTIDHGHFLNKVKQDGVNIILHCGRGKPKLCRPYIVVKGRKLEHVEQAVEEIHRLMINHQKRCDCLPKWQPPQPRVSCQHRTGCLTYGGAGKMPLPKQDAYPADESGTLYPELCAFYHKQGLICAHQGCWRDHTPHTEWAEPLATFMKKFVDETADLQWNSDVVTPDWIGMPLNDTGGRRA